jgi:HAD superfamily hydrolase (TIGR01509 family)
MANNLEFTRIKAVALDFDGVMANLDLDWKVAIRQASEIAGYDIKSLITFYEKCFGTPLFQEISAKMEKLEMQALKTSPILPQVKETVEKLVERKADLYIVSMQSYLVIKTFLDQNGLAGYFKEIVTREKCPDKKAQVEYVLKTYNVNPSQLLLIDDSKRNIALCSELGISCFHFQNRVQFFRNDIAAKDLWSKVLSLLDCKSKSPKTKVAKLKSKKV